MRVKDALLHLTEGGMTTNQVGTMLGYTDGTALRRQLSRDFGITGGTNGDGYEKALNELSDEILEQPLKRKGESGSNAGRKPKNTNTPVTPTSVPQEPKETKKVTKKEPQKESQKETKSKIDEDALFVRVHYLPHEEKSRSSIRLPNELMDWLQDFAKRERLNQGDIMTIALRDLRDKYDR